MAKDLTTLSTKQLRDKLEDLTRADTVKATEMAALDRELRLRKAAKAKAKTTGGRHEQRR